MFFTKSGLKFAWRKHANRSFLSLAQKVQRIWEAKTQPKAEFL